MTATQHKQTFEPIMFPKGVKEIIVENSEIITREGKRGTRLFSSKIQEIENQIRTSLIGRRGLFNGFIVV